MQVVKTPRRLIVRNSKFVEIHRWFRDRKEWEKFLNDPRISLPPFLEGKEAVVLVLALPQMALERKHTTLSKRLYIPREMLKEISKGAWVVELVVRIQLVG